MLRLLATVEVKLLIVDEIQRILADHCSSDDSSSNVIKHLGDELQIPIVAAGTQDAFNAIQTETQLANRFEPVLLRRWTMGDDDLRLLASFEVAVPLEQRSGLVEPVRTQDSEFVRADYRRDLSVLCRAALDGIERGHRMNYATQPASGYGMAFRASSWPMLLSAHRKLTRAPF